LELARASSRYGARRVWTKKNKTGGDHADNEARWHFDHLKTENLAQANRHLRAVPHGKPRMKHDELQPAAVGLRTGELLDVDVAQGVGLDDDTAKRAMMSWEIRTDSTLGADFDQRFADRLQKGLLTGDYGLSRTQFNAWYGAQTGNENQILSQMYFNRPNSASNRLRDTWEYHEAISASPELQQINATDYGRRSNDNYYLRLLVHDWNQDPMLFERPDLQERVFAAQRKALHQIANGVPSQTAIAGFVDESGLLRTSCNAMGLEVSPARQDGRRRRTNHRLFDGRHDSRWLAGDASANFPSMSFCTSTGRSSIQSMPSVLCPVKFHACDTCSHVGCCDGGSHVRYARSDADGCSASAPRQESGHGPCIGSAWSREVPSSCVPAGACSCCGWQTRRASARDTMIN